jgi:hypothetical protein
MNNDDIVPLALLGGGLLLLGMAAKKGPRKLKDRTGEKCDPKATAPYGYDCGQVMGGWELVPEKEEYIGFGHYNSRAGVDAALESLGFPNGDLAGFQRYMSAISEWDLRSDGQIDKDTLIALEEAEGLLRRDEWLAPYGGVQ